MSSDQVEWDTSPLICFQNDLSLGVAIQVCFYFYCDDAPKSEALNESLLWISFMYEVCVIALLWYRSIIRYVVYQFLLFVASTWCWERSKNPYHIWLNRSRLWWKSRWHYTGWPRSLFKGANAMLGGPSLRNA